MESIQSIQPLTHSICMINIVLHILAMLHEKSTAKTNFIIFENSPTNLKMNKIKSERFPFKQISTKIPFNSTVLHSN